MYLYMYGNDNWVGNVLSGHNAKKKPFMDLTGCFIFFMQNINSFGMKYDLHIFVTVFMRFTPLGHRFIRISVQQVNLLRFLIIRCICNFVCIHFIFITG